MKFVIEAQPATSATRAAAVVFGVHLSAWAAFRLDPDYSGPAVRPCV